jgi:glycosyltransferase involved in cell wall biosynthesis
MGESVTVVIPAHNPGPWLEEALRSTQHQGVRAPVVVVDNGSREAIEARVHAALPTATVVRQDPASGASGSRNAGVAATDTDWIAFLDCDDRFMPNKLARQFDAIANADRPVSFCHTQWNVIDADGSLARRGWGYDVDWADLLDGKFGVVMSSILVRRDIFDAIGGFDTAIVGAEDIDFEIRLAAQARPLFVDEALIEYRLNPTGQTSRYRPTYAGADLVMRKHLVAARASGDERAAAAIGRGRRRVRHTFAAQAFDAARAANQTRDYRRLTEEFAWMLRHTPRELASFLLAHLGRRVRES